MTAASGLLSVAIAMSAPTLSAAGARFAVPGPATAVSDASAGAAAVHVLLSLGLVIGAIVLIGWLARRLRVMPRARTGALRVVDEIALGAKERAVILEVDGAWLVLGVGEGRVLLLHRFEAATQHLATAAESDVGASGGHAGGQAPFSALLRKTLGW